jgi:hypothetical protein
MAGTLTINSSGDGSLLSGHSWIEYQPDGGQAHTYGTWGNNPMGEGNGLHTDLELGMKGDVQRTTHLTDEQEKKMFAKIEDYQKKGPGGWGYLSPCSTFASDTWEAGTGEHLDNRSYGVISNPSKLKQSIEALNKKDPDSQEPTLAQQFAGNSRRKIQSAIEECPLSSSEKH